ncbi:MAG: SoxR reducing system RseC family protein, partial [Deltaproteobacteria bacterium]
MLEEEGRVTSVDGVYAFVAAQPSSSCEGCSQKGACHVLGGSGEMIIKADNEIRAEVGDRVIVAISSKTFFKASAVIYLLPVAALIIGGVFGKSIAPRLNLNIQPETLSAI